MSNPRLSAGPLSARICLIAVSGATILIGQDMARPKPVQPIPRSPYKTWSLFLINNPQWLVAESKGKIKTLYDQFEAFGKAIGPNHVAVWFWSGEAQADVDVGRSVEFCEKLKLAPSGGPYILVTSDYPGKGLTSDPSSILPTPLKSYYTLSLNNKSADEIIQLLTTVADKITADRLSELNSSSKGWWRGWQATFEGIRSFLSSRQMTVSIKTPFSEVQIK
jgi:hypothetical protein